MDAEPTYREVAGDAALNVDDQVRFAIPQASGAGRTKLIRDVQINQLIEPIYFPA